MANFSSMLQTRTMAHSFQFAGNAKQSQRASASEENDSDASSIHTNPETSPVVAKVDQTLDRIKQQISPEDWAILSGAKFHFVDEVNRLKHSGRKWQRNADNIGEEFLYTSNQLESTNQKLKEALKARQKIEQQYAEQGQKLKATEEQLQDEAKINADIERLTRESQEIQEALKSAQ